MASPDFPVRPGGGEAAAEGEGERMAVARLAARMVRWLVRDSLLPMRRRRYAGRRRSPVARCGGAS
uniref:Uncharacterized protein n=1 Tax=Oryza nivara TaxID=4536 RepID=A0A0E0IZK4_ORYNI